MKKVYNFILILPLAGLASIYIYVLMTIISIDSTDFYKFDPKQTPINYIYDFFYPLPAIGHLGILIGCIILLIDYFKFKGGLTLNSCKWIYFIGTILTVFLHFVDVGYCQIWFFD